MQRPNCRSEFRMRAGKVAAALRRYLSGEKTRSAGGSSPKILIQESPVLTRCWRKLSVLTLASQTTYDVLVGATGLGSQGVRFAPDSLLEEAGFEL
jgi:hypothetical protein